MLDLRVKEDKEETSEPLYFEAVKGGDNIQLMASHEGGTRFYIITITPEGKFFRAGGVPEKLGLELDDGGRIVEGTL